MAVLSGPEQAVAMKRGTFVKGQSGNPAGRPKGSGEAAALRAALADQLDDVIEVVVQRALSGDMQAAALLLSRALPALKPASEAAVVRLPKGSMTDQARHVVSRMAAGCIPEAQGIALVNALASIAKMRSVEEMTAQVDALQTEVEAIRNEITRNKNR